MQEKRGAEGELALALALASLIDGVDKIRRGLIFER